VSAKKTRKRPNAYLAQLSEEEREVVRGLLISRCSIKSAQSKIPRWKAGRNTGEKPSSQFLVALRNEFVAEDMLERLNGAAERIEASEERLKKLVKDKKQEELIDRIMTVIADEVLHNALYRTNALLRCEAIKLLLKRADQRAVYAKIRADKVVVKKDKTPPLTPEEKKMRMRQVFGMV
jgi:hypothetical protein